MFYFFCEFYMKILSNDNKFFPQKVHLKGSLLLDKLDKHIKPVHVLEIVFYKDQPYLFILFHTGYFRANILSIMYMSNLDMERYRNAFSSIFT